MDPNKTLEAFYAAQRMAREALELGNDAAELEALHEAVEAADSLFQWLSNGGFLPKGWAR